MVTAPAISSFVKRNVLHSVFFATLKYRLQIGHHFVILLINKHKNRRPVVQPYTEQHCCQQLLPAIRPVYSQATVAGNTQLRNYMYLHVSYTATLLLATVPSNKTVLHVWPA